jgi:hypothetical protein
MDHHGSKVTAPPHHGLRPGQSYPFPSTQIKKGLTVSRIAAIVRWVDDERLEIQTQLGNGLADHRRSAQENRPANPFVGHNGSGANDLRRFPFAKYNPSGIVPGFVDNFV